MRELEDSIVPYKPAGASGSSTADLDRRYALSAAVQGNVSETPQPKLQILRPAALCFFVFSAWEYMRMKTVYTIELGSTRNVELKSH